MLNLFKKKKTVLDINAFEVSRNPEDPAVLYLESPDGLRLIFRDGVYVGWYTPDLAEPLN